MYTVQFYESRKGQEPVKDFLENLTRKEKVKIFKYVALLEEKKPAELSCDSHYKNLSRYPGLWEVRVDFGRNGYRIFYFYHDEDTVVLLHAFKKKTNETPSEELAIALKNKEDWEMRGHK
jgi:phage-related protein